MKTKTRGVDAARAGKKAKVEVASKSPVVGALPDGRAAYRSDEEARVNRALAPRPRDPRELHEWVVKSLGLHVPRRAVLAESAAPFDYLKFTFFEGLFDSMPARKDGVLMPERSMPPNDCVVWANRGGGKTLLGAIATLLDMLYKPGIAVRVLAGSMEQSGKMMAHLHRFFSPTFSIAMAGMVKGRVTDKRIELVNGSEVEVLAQSQTAVRGTHVQKLRCDEVDLFDSDVWDAAQFVTESKDCGGVHVRGSVECLSTMHQHFGVMFRLMMDVQEGKRKLFKWGLIDVLEQCGAERQCDGALGPDWKEPEPIVPVPGMVVPLKVLRAYGSKEDPCPLKKDCKGEAKKRAKDDAGHVRIEDAIVTKGRVSDEQWDAEALCGRPDRKGAVFPTFDVKRHVICGRGPQHVKHWLAGMDFGMRAPTVVLWGAEDTDGAIWIMDEWCKVDMVLEDHVAAIKMGLAREGVEAWPPVEWIAADPSGNQINQQTGVSDTLVLRRHGFTVKTPGGAVARGLNFITARLSPAAGWPRLFIHERCRELVRAMTKYRYKEGDLENMEPLKDGCDHAVDALRYLVMSVDKPEGGKSGSYLVG